MSEVEKLQREFKDLKRSEALAREELKDRCMLQIVNLVHKLKPRGSGLVVMEPSLKRPRKYEEGGMSTDTQDDNQSFSVVAQLCLEKEAAIAKAKEADDVLVLEIEAKEELRKQNIVLTARVKKLEERLLIIFYP
jgi:hypothetical protein